VTKIDRQLSHMQSR